MEESSKPWDQQDGEPNEAYTRFLIYRNLGPVRSLDSAYRSTLQQTATKRGKTQQRANGQWTEDSTHWNWVERATAWDIEMMSTLGMQTVVRFINSLEIISQKALQKLLDDKTKPRDWKSAVDAISRLGVFIPAETVEQIQAANARNEIVLGSRKPKDSENSV